MGPTSNGNRRDRLACCSVPASDGVGSDPVNRGGDLENDVAGDRAVDNAFVVVDDAGDRDRRTGNLSRGLFADVGVVKR